MGLEYRNLDDRTRTLMLAEIGLDIEADTLHLSGNLSQQGREEYPDLLRDAAQNGNDVVLAAAIRDRLNPFQKRRKLKSGGFSKPPKMPSNAHDMLAEGEFNRFHIRALCRRALEDGISEVIVYRAKTVTNPRPESEQKLGQRVPARPLLNDLRRSPIAAKAAAPRNNHLAPTAGGSGFPLVNARPNRSGGSL